MSSKPPIAYIEIRVSQHATENPEKVKDAVKNLVSFEFQEDFIFENLTLAGHHGNPINLFTATLTNKSTLPAIIQKIAQNLPTLDKEQLSQDIDLHIEKGNLYLRFDKQNAYLGQPKFALNDPIRLKIHFKNKTSPEIIEFCKNIGLLP